MGYIVLTFDYRGWGESDGKLIRVGNKPDDAGEEFTVKVKEVRTIVDPLDQLEGVFGDRRGQVDVPNPRTR